MDLRLNHDAFQSARKLVENVDGATELLECMSNLYEDRDDLEGDMRHGFRGLITIFAEAEQTKALAGPSRKRENESEGPYFVLRGTKKPRSVVNRQAGAGGSEGSDALPLSPYLGKHDPHDIAKGQENVKIPWENNVNSERPSNAFTYMKANEVYQNANVDRTLSSLPNDCQECYGDCLEGRGCGCAIETKGVYAYKRDGLLTRTFLKHLMRDRDTPGVVLERCGGECLPEVEQPGPCKGHEPRTFIQECYVTCVCSMACGNRVVQRGITRQLAVVYYPRKGWGLCSRAALPCGAFVCEYAGEILNEMELTKRQAEAKAQKTPDRHTFPMSLRACWRTENPQDDESALNLDATFRGNVGRFVNHRCADANMREVPVMIDSISKRYHHVAFFTTREIRAGEELTWDYGLDFNDNDNEKEPSFECVCGSDFCRGFKNG